MHSKCGRQFRVRYSLRFAPVLQIVDAPVDRHCLVDRHPKGWPALVVLCVLVRLRLLPRHHALRELIAILAHAAVEFDQFKVDAELTSAKPVLLHPQLKRRVAAILRLFSLAYHTTSALHSFALDPRVPASSFLPK